MTVSMSGAAIERVSRRFEQVSRLPGHETILSQAAGKLRDELNSHLEDVVDSDDRHQELTGIAVVKQGNNYVVTVTGTDPDYVLNEELGAADTLELSFFRQSIAAVDRNIRNQLRRLIAGAVRSNAYTR